MKILCLGTHFDRSENTELGMAYAIGANSSKILSIYECYHINQSITESINAILRMKLKQHWWKNDKNDLR